MKKAINTFVHDDLARKRLGAFTVVEMLIVIAIIGLLSTITTVTFTKVQQNGRDSSRAAKAKSIAAALESYYQENGEYPGCSMLTQSADIVSSQVLVDLVKDNLTTPTASSGTNSIYCGDISGTTADVFAYVGSSCTTACTQFTLQYRNEATSSTKSIASRHS